MRFPAGLHALAAGLLALATPFGLHHPRGPLEPYRGTGSWVSIYDTAAWANPGHVVQTLERHRVHTLFLETANDRQRAAVVRPAAVSRFLEDAHAAGIDVVGWYVPSLATPARDLRRALAGARFASANGETFDSFALDLEATNVRSLALRSERAVRLTAAVRRALPSGASLGAITIDPVGARYWDGYPFARLARSVDVFLPMAYFTARTHGPKRVGAYSRANVDAVRLLAGRPGFPVHPIAGEARRASLRELRAFVDATTRTRTLGWSLWEYGETSPRQWATLAESSSR